MRGRLFFTVWLIYCLHFSSNVVRETYLAISLAERGSIRVDEYLGLHPDLFEIPGRGAYINNNPGASLLGAIPYLVARPLLGVVYRVRPSLLAPKPPAIYDDPRPNRTRFMNEARARGLDIKLGLAALVMQVGLMAPLGALAAVVMFMFLREHLSDERTALWLAVLFAFGTPNFFRAGFLNQNAILAHLTLFAFVLLAGAAREERPEPPSMRALVAAGACIGLGLLCDYSAAPLLIVFGAWALALGARGGGIRLAVRSGALFAAGAAVPILLLLMYQWSAFGSPWYPAQRYMPATGYSAQGWFGMGVPSWSLLLGNLFDPRFGLFVYSPMLVGALAAPFITRPAAGPTRLELTVIFAGAIGLWLFSSANQFAYLQWNTGVRYMVPAAPLLFIALVPVLLRVPVPLRWSIVLATLVVSWSVTMTRESVPRALHQVATSGFELPTLTVLRKMSSGYASWAAGGVSPIPLFCLTAIVLWLIWRNARLAS